MWPTMFDLLRKKEYVSKNEDYTEADTESLLRDSNSSSETLLDSQRQRRRPCVGTVLILLTTHAIVAVVAAWLGGHWGLDVDSLCSLYTSQYSPVIEEVGISYHTVQYNGSFFKQEIYRRDPSPEVDAAWKALGMDYRAISVPESEAQKAGLASDQVKIRDKYGGGYPANVEGLHHLHCLNLLRQSLVYNYDYYAKLGKGAFLNEEPIVKVHVTHCLDIIRQQLMCTIDTGVLGQVWTNVSSPTAFVDFNTKHRCKNFDAIRSWAEERQLPSNPPPDFLEPPKAGDRIYAEIP